ncbi:Kunitz/Bovine pancreatic trypsin inhibitor domain protein [Teladorsagia circumcincta]|uniref:Kunitz/Bovine pancreatic trypsin inhibitor domain protein n=1 Tax=Teladorsagia circumcincta TaxID=45464 RepID=A0A2G9U2B0_TELCI|nr:Kunitz/Bovine pancreatic trypsin inhibitor domain protein [Teladorsagia circumcincta]
MIIIFITLLLGQSVLGADLGGVLCRLPKDEGYECGIVGAAHSAFHFDTDIRECIEFMFKGCGGNQNRFASKEDCLQGCKSLTLCGKGLPLMDFAGNIKRCEADRVPCPGSHECIGRGMESVCCQKAVICPRGDPHPDRYSINKIATCHEDKHCPRNYTCTARIGKKGACCPSKGSCPNELEQHYNPITGQPQLCDAKAKIGCPLGFECVKTSPFAAICCRTTPVCPAAESIVLAEKGMPKLCDPSHHDSCPEQYSCQQADNLEHICCTRPLECPNGMKALREDGGRPRACTLGVEGNCPGDHVCVLGEGMTVGSGARHLCCRPEKVCIVPYVDITKKRPQRCFPAPKCSRSNPMSCSSEYVCERLIDGSNACCPNPLTEQTCIEAVVDDNNSSIPCKGWDDNSCQEGKCRQAVDGKYYCCRSASALGIDQQDPQFIAMRSELLQTAFRSRLYSDVHRIHRAPNVPLIGASTMSSSSAAPSTVQSVRITATVSTVKPLMNRRTSRRPVPYYLRRLHYHRNSFTL